MSDASDPNPKPAAHADERAKWDAYYRTLPDHAIDAATEAFHGELLGALDELLPGGGQVLEAGAGGGLQSLAIAASGRHRVTVLDFAPEALAHARRRFEKAGQPGQFVEDDAFALRTPMADLVFNSGVLEHYTVDEQARFLRGMKSRSRRYVLVLVPNRACYWYWLWRIRKTATESWPFGKEVPSVDLSVAFARAGLRYLGHAFFGAGWTESFLGALGEVPGTLRDELLAIHRSGVIPDASRGYLFAALGELPEVAPGPVPPRWRLRDVGGDPTAAEAVAAIADALAGRLAAEHRLRETVAAHDERVAALEAGLVAAGAPALRPDDQAAPARPPAPMAATQDGLAEQVVRLEAQLQVAHRQLDEVSHWATYLDRHPLLHFTKQSIVRVARTMFRLAPLPATTKHRLYARYAAWQQRRAQAARASAAAPAAQPVVVPGLPAAHGADVFVFGIVDWHFRIQRPQQLALELARAGHRVFYVTPAFVDASTPGAAIDRLDPTLPLWNVRLHAPGAPSIYRAAPSPTLVAELRAGLASALGAIQPVRCLALVDHAFWTDLAASLPNADLVYDCMDHHEGFGGVADSLLALEDRLVGEADLVLTSSSWLAERIGPKARHHALVRNAGEYQRFATAPAQIHRDPSGRPVIGYFGAIAEWFDVDLVAELAAAFPDCVVKLIGSDTVGAQRRLGHLPNVVFTGELPYQDLPAHLHGFDVCLLPFRVMPLTLATNPVKVYEYLAAGKPVVGTALPEMAQFGDLAHTAADATGFVAAVRRALAERTAESVAARQAFAAANTWTARAAAVLAAVAAIRWPKISVIVLSYNNVALTQACVRSVLEASDYPAVELIVVDNASSDGAADWLRTFAVEHPEVRCIFHERNLGYSAGNNAGLRLATGDYVVLLNNDTVVTRGWLRTMLRHLRRDPSIGLLGPITNDIGNEAKVAIDYPDLGAMPAAARALTLANAGRLRPMGMLAFFAVMIPRPVLDAVGGLDESYGIGWFEDDDYCRRVERLGKRLALAEDVFVHHQHSAAIKQIPQPERQALFERNKAIYERKWGPWRPHRSA